MEPLTAEFIVNEPPALLLISAQRMLQCSASDGGITASPGGGTRYLYHGMIRAQTAAAAAGRRDTYNVTVTDANGLLP